METRVFKKQPLFIDLINQIISYAEEQLDQQCSKFSIMSLPIRIEGRLLTDSEKNFVWGEIRETMKGRMFRSLEELTKAAQSRERELKQKRQKKPKCQYVNGFCVRSYDKCHTFTVCKTHMAQAAEGRRTLRAETYFPNH